MSCCAPVHPVPPPCTSPSSSRSCPTLLRAPRRSPQLSTGTPLSLSSSNICPTAASHCVPMSPPPPCLLSTPAPHLPVPPCAPIVSSCSEHCSAVCSRGLCVPPVPLMPHVPHASPPAPLLSPECPTFPLAPFPVSLCVLNTVPASCPAATLFHNVPLVPPSTLETCIAMAGGREQPAPCPGYGPGWHRWQWHCHQPHPQRREHERGDLVPKLETLGNRCMDRWRTGGWLRWRRGSRSTWWGRDSTRGDSPVP